MTINSPAYFLILYALVALWAAAVLRLLYLGVRRRRVKLVLIGLFIAWAGPAAMVSIQTLLDG